MVITKQSERETLSGAENKEIKRNTQDTKTLRGGMFTDKHKISQNETQTQIYGVKRNVILSWICGVAFLFV